MNTYYCPRCRCRVPKLESRENSVKAEIGRLAAANGQQRGFHLLAKAGLGAKQAKLVFMHLQREPGRCAKCGKAIGEGEYRYCGRCGSFNINWLDAGQFETGASNESESWVPCKPFGEIKLIKMSGDRWLARAAETLALAFQDDPFFSFIATKAEDRRRWLPIVQAANIRLTLPYGHTYVALDDARQVLGVVCAYPPGRYPLSPWQQLKFDAALALRPRPWIPPLGDLLKGTAYNRHWAEMHPPEPHWYLYNIGVHPNAQGKGVGRMLMQRIADDARSDGRPIHLETQNERNVPIYRACGFEVTDKREPRADGPPTWGMIRRAATPGSRD